jgi:hypothetical protein
MTAENRIRGLAIRFREAILKCDKDELPLSLADFPVGSCADASILLGTYFKDNGINGFILIKGKRGVGSSLETHYWLEKDKMIVDITADQFEDIHEAIFITDSNSTWHGTFKKEIRQEADYHMITARDVMRHLEAVYEYIIQEDRQ